MNHILIVDDDPSIRELVSMHLQNEGFGIFKACDGLEASEVLKKEKIHLAVIDIMMPNKNGYELCEEIRSFYDIPIIILSSKDQLQDKEIGFEYGADDYLVKPFEPKELQFRIKALLRRYKMLSTECIHLNQTVINPMSYEVSINGNIFILPLKEFELLSQLGRYPNRIFTREDLIQLIWGPDFDGDVRTVDVHIKRLRERFRMRTSDFMIKTIRGIGYKLEA
ncbi:MULTISPECIES: response regulator transcription factor [unclassified Bacillus (in: firmicutes)]|uniref:response regulator transcription factor n=1 Tax=unclassified Bacillus (in: firmicutes) TaxID=185979 RepID=UPI000BF15BD6|nr:MULTISPECIES: response regulator transcription factor [unclassified Bacillus (in: firmicutes)]PEJ57616.1 DNA-binding response regulator [Bacillus sp. AFS002410]PEL08385.1 DNA-binding response regulator [Bacillus sp. AFS017336]